MIDLAGHWELSDASGEFTVPMTVPGDGISALFDAGVIPDPYWGRNEYDLRWIADRDWFLRRSFDVTQDSQRWSVFADGLDCVAEIRINGALVLTAANAFRPHEMDVSDHIRLGTNEVEIAFKSSTVEANLRQAAQPFRVPYSDGNCPIPNGNMLRKQQCDFGWDWNIALAPFGLYGDIRICGNDPTDLRDIHISQTHSGGTVELNVRADFGAFADIEVPVSVEIDGQVQHSVVALDPQSSTFRFDFAPITIQDPHLWWPNGAGEQHLYDLRVTVGHQTRTIKLALRDVELISEPDDAGRNFGFRVNGRDIFAKGANWIPADALAGRITREKTKDLLQSAADANMNMLRVWGGGRYETDEFYEDCDQLGLLIWQDFMFSCNLYPADEAFLSDVLVETQHQANRLNHRVALWCGDNELIGALTWFEESRSNRDSYLVAYDRLNRTIEQGLKTVSPAANWWPSSPSPGPMSFGDAWHDDSSGDMHFWSVWHEGRDFEHYRDVKPRFCSEFGFQSFPSMPTIEAFAGSDDHNIASAVMESHQKNAGGNARIAETMFRYFRFPEKFEDFVYLSQVQQGVAMKTAVDYWRSLRPHSMGALYWQLNDTWPCASWASLNYGGSWKALHFMAKRFFAPVSVALIPDGQQVTASVSNETDQALKATLKFSHRTCDGTELVSELLSIDVAADTVSKAVIGHVEQQDENIIYADLYIGEDLIATDVLTTKPYKYMPLRAAEVSHVTELHDSELRISLRSERPAFFIALETEVPGRFSDNFVHLKPGQPVEITFRPNDPADVDVARNTMTLTDLHTATYRQTTEKCG